MHTFRADFQIYTFLYIFYAGFFSCFVHDLLTVLFQRQHILLRLIADLFLAVAIAFALFLAVFHSGAGALRIYMLFAFILGAALYHFGIQSVCKKAKMHMDRKRKKEKRGE